MLKLNRLLVFIISFMLLVPLVIGPQAPAYTAVPEPKRAVYQEAAYPVGFDDPYVTDRVKDLVQQGTNSYDSGSYKSAISKYDEAISLLKGELANIYYDKGNALCALDKYTDALKSYNLAINMNPNFAEAWYNKGFALQELGREAEANKAYAKAIDLGYTGPS